MNLSRRDLIRNTLYATAASSFSFLGNTTTLAAAETVAKTELLSVTKEYFTLPPLPYDYAALEPYIDTETMKVHHDKHHAAYVKKLNEAVASAPQLAGKTIDEILMNLNTIPDTVRTAIRNNGGGHANHSLFWLTLAPNPGPLIPKSAFTSRLNETFGSLAQFQEQFGKAAMGVFGSGWAWLTIDSAKKLQIETTPNQDSPLSAGRHPVFGLDVWEHAYYLKHENRRQEYVDAFWKIVNWDFISSRYDKLAV